MVRPLQILKMIHCRNISSKTSKMSSVRKRRKETKTSFDNSTRVKVERGEELCRVCLKEGQISIYEKEDLSEALSIFGAIEINPDDAYPKFLCRCCHALLQGAILFRKTAQESDNILKEHTEKPPDLGSDDGDYEHFASENEQADEDVPLSMLSKTPVIELNEEIHETNTPANKPLKKEVEALNTLSCKKCEIEFTTFEEYETHRLSLEHENKKQCCPICKKCYSLPYYKTHLAIHKKETPFMCDICGKNFFVSAQFSRHRLTHFYDLPFKCSLCPYKGRFSESLKMHMRSHTGEKPYQCSQCSAKFINKSNLNKHVLTHKGEHKFRCEVCGRGFYTMRDLDLHLRVDHTGIKDHVCNICHKAFGYRKQLMKHELKVHKREKLKSGRMPLYLKVENMKMLGEQVKV